MIDLNLKNRRGNSLINLLLVIAAFIYTVASPSCANQGVGPEGGLKDSIPPSIVSMMPVDKQTNFTGNQLEVTFNEYITLDNISQKLMISPPLAEKPTIKTKGKSIQVKFNEDLIPTRTYSVDFQNSIKDYNEGNKLESFRLLFSTYDKIDTLRISGYLLNAFNLEPVENAIALLHTVETDTAFSTMRPDYIAKADEKGFFLFDNLSAGKYRLFGLVDGDNNLKYTTELEQLAFYDSLIEPKTIFIEKIDTIYKEKDTIVSKGYNEYLPGLVFPKLFLTETYSQFIASNKRPERDFMQFTFSESLTDSFNIELVKHDSTSNWSYIEFGKERDTVSVWITDTLISNKDSLYFALHYEVTDSTKQFVSKHDTLKMFYAPPKQVKGKKDGQSTRKTEPFAFSSYVAPNNFDFFKPVIVEAPFPIDSLDGSKVHVFQLVDTLKNPVQFTLKLMENSKRKYHIAFDLKENSSYSIVIDSAATHTLNHVPNNVYELNFKTQKAEFYGTFILDLSGINGRKILQLLKNSKDEEVDQEFMLDENTQKAKLNYLKPGKYKVKLILDPNGNGKWDTGNYRLKTQPEQVFYFSKVIEIRSNWELKESWAIDPATMNQKELEGTEKKAKE